MGKYKRCAMTLIMRSKALIHCINRRFRLSGTGIKLISYSIIALDFFSSKLQSVSNRPCNCCCFLSIAYTVCQKLRHTETQPYSGLVTYLDR